jgi:hypothetical protein
MLDRARGVCASSIARSIASMNRSRFHSAKNLSVDVESLIQLCRHARVGRIEQRDVCDGMLPE